MAKKRAKAHAGGENVSAYFKKVFARKPSLLFGKSNAELLERWLADHPGHSSVPDNIKGNLDVRAVKWIDEVLGIALTQQPMPGQQTDGAVSPPPAAEVPEDKRGRRNGRRVKQVPPPAH